MRDARIDVRDVGSAGSAGAFAPGLEGQLPMPAPKHAAVSPEAKPRRSWMSLAGRIVRNAAIGVAIMTLVPVGLVVARGDHVARILYDASYNITPKLAAVEPVRSFALPADGSITPMQAGMALNALQQHRAASPGFTAIEPSSRPVATWRNATMSPDMFLSARPKLFAGPSSRDILEAVAKGFSPREMEYLRTLATAPVWHEFDLVARAPAVDMIGGRLVVPFGNGASIEQFPMPQLKTVRELSDAAVSRAAYFMARGERDSAETVLRSIISFGFAFVDNGTTRLDELVGAMIVGTGRDALQRFYLLEHDPRASLAALAPPARVGATARVRTVMSADEARHQFLARIEDPAVPLGERFEGLRFLSMASCTNAREMLFGPRADVTDVLARARRTVARYPSERALLDLRSGVFDQTSVGRATNPLQSFAVSAASISGAVLHNPRLAGCTLLLSSNW